MKNSQKWAVRIARGEQEGEKKGEKRGTGRERSHPKMKPSQDGKSYFTEEDVQIANKHGGDVQQPEPLGQCDEESPCTYYDWLTAAPRGWGSREPAWATHRRWERSMLRWLTHSSEWGSREPTLRVEHATVTPENSWTSFLQTEIATTTPPSSCTLGYEWNVSFTQKYVLACSQPLHPRPRTTEWFASGEGVKV